MRGEWKVEELRKEADVEEEEAGKEMAGHVESNKDDLMETGQSERRKDSDWEWETVLRETWQKLERHLVMED